MRPLSGGLSQLHSFKNSQPFRRKLYDVMNFRAYVQSLLHAKRITCYILAAQLQTVVIAVHVHRSRIFFSNARRHSIETARHIASAVVCLSNKLRHVLIAQTKCVFNNTSVSASVRSTPTKPMKSSWLFNSPGLIFSQRTYIENCSFPLKSRV